MKYFEVLMLTVKVRTVSSALARLELALKRSVPGTHLLGCWTSELGPQNQIAILRGFDSLTVRQSERERLLLESNGLDVSDVLLNWEFNDYTIFPFLKPLEPGSYGPLYEFREYSLVGTGLAPTLSGWQKAVGARTTDEYSQVYAALYATSGSAPRYLHIWPYQTLEQRLDVRSRTVSDGVWPPENSGPQLQLMKSTLFLPASFSPLQ